MKTKIFFLILVSLVAANKLNAQWFWESPYQTGVKLNDVHSADGINYWIVGDLGTIMKYDGIDFDYYPFTKTTKLNSIQLNSETSGWIVGDSGTILKYDGSSWQEQSSPTTYNLNSIWIIDQDNALACGDHGTILQYSNNTWSIMASPYTIFPLVSISATDGYIQAVGGDGGLTSIELEYIDQNWVTYLYEGYMDLRVTYQYNNSHGWNGGRQYIPYYTGATIYHRSEPNGSYASEYNHCGGEPFCYATISDIVMNDIDQGWSAEFYSSEEYFNLDDPLLSTRINNYNGVEWSPQFEDTNYAITKICSPTANEFFGVGPAGQMIHFKNNLWNKLNSFFPKYLNGIVLLDENNGWAVGEDGFVIKLENGTWFLQPQFSNIDLKDISFIDDNHGWCVAGTTDFTPYASGTIYKYTNGSWLPEFYSDIFLTSISMVDAGFGIAIGGYGYILKYNGNTWSEIYCPATGIEFLDVDMVNSNFGAIVGGEGTILMYNGSGFYQVSGLPNNVIFKSVSFSDTDNGWAIGSQGNVYRYKNGNWSFFDNFPKILVAVNTINESLAYIVGGGVIYRYNGISWEKQSDENGKSAMAPAFQACSFINDTVGVSVGGLGADFGYTFYYAAIMKTSNGGVFVGVHEQAEKFLSSEFQNIKIFPNPILTEATISFSLMTDSKVEIDLFDIYGKHQKNIVSSQIMSAGKHNILLEMSDIPSGIYFIKMIHGNSIITQKLIKGSSIGD